MKVVVSVGPGQHGTFLLRELARHGCATLSVRSWPRFQVERWSGDLAPAVLARNPWYGRLAWLCWAAWRRLPRLGRYQTPAAWLFALHDRLARRVIEQCDVFLGWAQVSLLSLREARRRGAVAVLEHPMVHVGEWMATVREEYARWGSNAARYPNLFPRSLVRRMEQEYAEADYIVVLSRFARDTFAERGVNGERLLWLPLGVDVTHFHPGEASPDSPFRVIYVGRIELLKGVHYLLRAFAELDLPGAELWLVGPALPEMAPFLERYRGAYRHFGEVPQAQLPRYYTACSVAVLPSIGDGFGLVILEAMASGLPVIATDHTAAADLMTDGLHGFIVPVRDVRALKEKLAYLYGHRHEAQAMGARARERVVSTFTWEHYGDRLMEAYSALVDRRRQALRPS